MSNEPVPPPVQFPQIRTTPKPAKKFAAPQESGRPTLWSIFFKIVTTNPFPKTAPNPTKLDLSQTDGRTVASLTSLAIGLMTFFTCFLLGPIPPAAGLVLAVFAKPSALRTIALVGNCFMLAVSCFWMLNLLMEIVSDPILGPSLRH